MAGHRDNTQTNPMNGASANQYRVIGLRVTLAQATPNIARTSVAK